MSFKIHFFSFANLQFQTLAFGGPVMQGFKTVKTLTWKAKLNPIVNESVCGEVVSPQQNVAFTVSV